MGGGGKGYSKLTGARSDLVICPNYEEPVGLKVGFSRLRKVLPN